MGRPGLNTDGTEQPMLLKALQSPADDRLPRAKDTEPPIALSVNNDVGISGGDDRVI